MRVYSVKPQYQASQIKRSNRTEASNSVMPVSVNNGGGASFPGVHISFTGADKNIHQFVSYAPENKRYNVSNYSSGGLGVVSYEAPVSWRLHENADVRDFSPYHSFDNADGGIKVVKLKKDADGKIIDSYAADSFIRAEQNESLADIAKRVKLEQGEELSYAIQLKPGDDGKHKFIRLEDAGIQGSFTRPADNAIDQVTTVPYRLFRAVDIKDSVDVAIDNYKNSILTKIQKPYIEPITAEVREEFKEQLAAAAEKDKAATELMKKEAEIIRKNKPNVFIDTADIKTETLKVEAKIKKEVKERLGKHAEIKAKFDEKLKTQEVIDYIKGIKAKAAPEVAERNAVYFLHTKELARFENAYGIGGSSYGTYGSYGSYGSYGTLGKDGMKTVSTNIAYADNNRALVDLMPKLNTEAHGNYNPANWWLHDRPAFITMNSIADASHFGNDYYNGLKIHGTFHNPGRDYQGAESNPFEFFRMVAREEDVKLLNKHKQLEKLRNIEKNWASASDEEKRFANQILRPFMENFLDDYVDTAKDVRTFNISMTPVAGTRINPKNMSAGSVSVNYGKEMKSLETPDIAQFMTAKLAKIKTIDITNGNTPANLKLNDAEANFCQNGEINGLTKKKAGFTTYEYKPVFDDAGKLVSDNLDEVMNAKKANLKWFLDTVGNAYETGGSQGITKIFFSDAQIKKGASIIGSLSKFNEGDMMFIGWGRPDPQKGYPSTFQSFLEFLKDPNIDKEVKKHTKLIVGAGIWDDGARDFEWVKDIIKQIESLDGGIYKGNACYVNGFFPNRLVGCATYSIFSSRFEPCGITPLESFAAGTPVISNNTGGAPDFITATRGYLTKRPYLINPSELNIPAEVTAGKSGAELGNIIDSYRMNANALELKDCLMAATKDYKLQPEEGKLSKYAEMVKDALNQKIDWHNNNAYNGGKSANERYMTEVFEVDKGMNARNFEKLKRLVGDKFGIADALKDGAQKARNRWTRILIGTGIGIAAAGTAAYVYLKDKNKKTEQAADAKPEAGTKAEAKAPIVQPDATASASAPVTNPIAQAPSLSAFATAKAASNEETAKKIDKTV